MNITELNMHVRIKVDKLSKKKQEMARKMHKTVDSAKSNSAQDSHGFVKNGTGYTAMQSFK